MDADQKKIEEYREAGSSYRYQNSIFIAELFVFIFSNLILLNIYLSHANGSSSKIFISTVGVVLSVVFYIIADRAGDYMHASRNRAKEIEKELGLNLYTSNPKGRQFFTAINLIRFTYLFGLTSWAINAMLTLL